MMLTVTVHDSPEATILRCRGRIVRGKETDTLGSAVLSRQHKGIVILDLAEVEVIDASGLGLLISLQACGIYLKLMNPSNHVVEVLKLTGLDRVFEIFSPAERVAPMGGDPTSALWMTEN